MAISAMNVATATPDSTTRDLTSEGSISAAGASFADLFASLGLTPEKEILEKEIIAGKDFFEHAEQLLTIQQQSTLKVSNDTNPLLPSQTSAESPVINNLLSELELLQIAAANPAVISSNLIQDKKKEDKSLVTENIQNQDPTSNLGVIANLFLPVQPAADNHKAPEQLTQDIELISDNNRKSSSGFEAAVQSVGPASEPNPEAFNLLTATHQSQASATHGSGPSSASSISENHISAPVHDQVAWSQQVGDRVILMNKAGQQTAELHLNPSNLGPMQVTLSFNADQSTSALFIAHHAETRQAIQDALPQLKEMFASAGIALGQANVSSQSQQQNSNSSQQDTPRSSRDTAILPGDKNPEVAVRVIPIKRGAGVVDLFA